MQKSLNRDKVVSVKMSASTYEQLTKLAKDMDLMTSTMAYLVIRKFISDKVDPDMSPTDFDLL